jgi:hypothetical protein
MILYYGFKNNWKMKPATILLACLLTACAATVRTEEIPLGKAEADSTQIRNDIAYLASDRLEGRMTGTPGNDSAAAYIARRYRALNLKAPFPDYQQRFVARSAAMAHSGDTAGMKTQNVVAILPGTDPVLRNQYIVIGAHFDHLGRTTQFATDPRAGNVIRNGADDNASGTAAVLQLARMLSVSRPRRSVIFANFTGEEEGLLGSEYLVQNSPVPLDSIVAMLNFDMVGRLRNEKLLVFGSASAAEFRALLDSANVRATPAFNIQGGGDGFGASDNSSFYAKNIPTLHFFTDSHDDYHAATDDVEKINASGEARVVDLAFNTIKELDARPSRLTFVKSTAPAQMAGSSGTQAYLGSVPDMSAGSVPGIKLTGVRAGSPAETGGLKADDIIIELGGARITDLQTYAEALYSHKPGETVTIVFLRAGQRMETKVTLGTRGG